MKHYHIWGILFFLYGSSWEKSIWLSKEMKDSSVKFSNTHFSTSLSKLWLIKSGTRGTFMQVAVSESVVQEPVHVGDV